LRSPLWEYTKMTNDKIVFSIKLVTDQCDKGLGYEQWTGKAYYAK